MITNDDFIINWVKFRERLNTVYRYCTKMRYIECMRILDSIYERWEKGERSFDMKHLYDSLGFEFLFNEEGWSEDVERI
jgi:hypothetical protein